MKKNVFNRAAYRTRTQTLVDSASGMLSTWEKACIGTLLALVNCRWHQPLLVTLLQVAGNHAKADHSGCSFRVAAVSHYQASNQKVFVFIEQDNRRAGISSHRMRSKTW